MYLPLLDICASHLSVDLFFVYAEFMFICESVDQVEGIANVAADKLCLAADSVRWVGAVVSYES